MLICHKITPLTNDNLYLTNRHAYLVTTTKKRMGVDSSEGAAEMRKWKNL